MFVARSEGTTPAIRGGILTGVRGSECLRKGEGIMATSRSRAEVEREMKNTIGLVPSFFGRIPDEFIDLEWELFKRMELGQTLIPNKYKELMGIALHSETKCHYCTLFHTEAAKLFGATDEEIEEAAHYAKMSVGWSAYVNGIQLDYDQFKRELEEMRAFLYNQKMAA
jgi:AhpD family alkylhydroperoxidase